MGLANTPTGFVYGFISTAMGILLVSRGVPLARVGEISAVAFSPTFWAWLLAPILDVRFTKRTYGFFFAALAAVLLAVTVLSLGNLTRFTAALTASCASIVLYSNSVAGWTPDIVTDAEFDTMSGWFNVANLGAAGLFSAVVVVLVRTLPLPIAATCLGLLVFAPTLLLVYFPAAPIPSGKIRENFHAMTRDLGRVLRQTRTWIGLILFLAPVGAFALTNLFSSLGGDFHANENFVTTLNGPGVAIACSAGCLLAIPLCRRLRRRTVYLIAGTGAAIAATAMGLLPHTAAIYAVGVLAYNFFQGFNYTSFVALELEIVGPRNAVSGTMMAMLTASANVPISTMTWLDGHIHDTHGLRAMLFVDAASAAVTAAILLLIILPKMEKRLANSLTSNHGSSR